MADTLTLEQLEIAAQHLPPAERLQLAERISRTLNQQTPEVRIKFPVRSLPAEDYLALCEEVAQLWEGEFDSAADLRRLREEE